MCVEYRDGYGSICMAALLKRKRKVADAVMKRKIAELRDSMIWSGICPDCGADLDVKWKRFFQFWLLYDVQYTCPEHGVICERYIPCDHNIGGP